MNKPQKIHSLDWRNTARHVTDLVISSVIALFIVTTILLTTGCENLNWESLPNSSFEFLSIFQAPSQFDLDLNKKESVLIGFSLVIAICLVVITTYSLLHNKISNKLSGEDFSNSQRYQNYFAGALAERSNPLKLNRDNGKLIEKQKEHLSVEDLTNTNNRVLLLKELKGMHGLISGEEKQRLKELYYALGFIDDLPNKFKSKDWVQRVEAIHEVKQFEVAKYYPTIFKLINDSNSTVKRNSLLARIDLEGNPLDILDDINSKLSIWEKHNITLALDKLPSHHIPNFQDLMKSYPLHHEFLSEMNLHFHQNVTGSSRKVNPKLYVA